MSDEAPPVLTRGPLRLTLSPETGGSIARFDYQDRLGREIGILRGAGLGSDEAVLAQGSFPLVPYCNRIRGGSFRFRNRIVTLAKNLPGDASPLHGQGWLACWDVVGSDSMSAELLFRHEAGEWPWDYEARQMFELDPQGLTLVLACSNRSSEPMPCGLGQHPYFPCTSETRLDTRVACAWTVDENVLPVDKVPAEGRYDLRDRRVCGQGLDNGFGGWGGRARIDDASLPFAIVMSSPDADYFQLYSPAAGGLFVAEPVSHANAALNAPEEEWPSLGIRVLEPGDTMILAMRIDVLPRQ